MARQIDSRDGWSADGRGGGGGVRGSIWGRWCAARRGATRRWKQIKQSWQLYVMLFLPLLWLVIFAYIPMYGAQIAFRNYNVVARHHRQPVGRAGELRAVLNSFNFWPILRKTLVLNLYQLWWGSPLPIIFALALNYAMRGGFRRSVQMVTYAPHFISTVVMVGIILQMLSTMGLVNQYPGQGRDRPDQLHGRAVLLEVDLRLVGRLADLGFNSIIYPRRPDRRSTHAARGRRDRRREQAATHPRHRSPGHHAGGGDPPHPAIGLSLSTAFEKVYLLQNPLNQRTSEVHRHLRPPGRVWSRRCRNCSYAAAIGLFKAVDRPDPDPCRQSDRPTPESGVAVVASRQACRLSDERSVASASDWKEVTSGQGAGSPPVRCGQCGGPNESTACR